MPKIGTIYVDIHWNGVTVELQMRTKDRDGFNTAIKPTIALIKQIIPASQRSYHPLTKIWTLDLTAYKNIKPALILMGWTITETKMVNAFEAEINNSDHINPDSVEVDEDFAENFHYNVAKTPKESKESISQKLSFLLGVVIKDQSELELKKIYRRKALELHPDRNSGDGSKMSELNMLWSAFISK